MIKQHPYRSSITTNLDKPKKKCFLFHSWFPVMKEEKKKEIQGIIVFKEYSEYPRKFLITCSGGNDCYSRKTMIIDIIDDYILQCEDCNEQKAVPENNMVYQNLILEDIKKRREIK